MKITKQIKGKNFVLRRIKRSDAFSLAKSINNKKIYKNTLTIPYPYTIKDAKEWIEKDILERRKKIKKNVDFIIDIKGAVVGGIGISKIEKEHKGELGYWLAEDYWGQGIVTEAIGLIERLAFRDLKLKRVTAHIFSFNKGSAKVLEKNNYHFEGIMKKEIKKDGKYIDVFLYSKVK